MTPGRRQVIRLFCPLVLVLAVCAPAPPAAAEPFDYAPLQALYDTYLDDAGNVDYAGLKAQRAALDTVVDAFAAARPDGFATDEARFAFWINAYNLTTIAGVVDAYPTKSVKDIKMFHGFFSRVKFPVAGRTLTLNDIEHEILRAQFADARLHFTIVCASASCPRLQPQVYRPTTLEAQLDAATREFLAAPSKNRIDPATGTVRISKIFDWFPEDFVAAAGSVPAFIARYVDADRAALIQSGAPLEYLDYDWGLNDQQPVD